MHVDYDWSVKKLAETPEDEQIGAGVPMEILVGVMKAWPTRVCPCGKCGYCKAADYLRAHRIEGYC